jgi:hypothetical protein
MVSMGMGGSGTDEGDASSSTSSAFRRPTGAASSSPASRFGLDGCDCTGAG